MTRVSIIIPTRNAGARFARTLEMIRLQRYAAPTDVIVIDSGSTDGTRERAAAAGATVVPIDRRSFHHARTRNLAIARSSGDIVVLLVQDATPADDLWLAHLVEPLRDAPQVAGSYSRHLPQADAGFLARQAAEYWFREQGGIGRIQRLDPGACLTNLADRERRRLFTFNSVSGAIRRDAWQRVPLPDVRYGEDLAWGYRVVREGFCLAYVPESRVVHSHERSLWYEFRRAYVDAKAAGELFGDPAETLSARELLTLLCAWVTLLLAISRPTLLQTAAQGEMPPDLPGGRGLPDDVCRRIIGYARELVRLAADQQELTPDLAGAILRLSCTLNIGQRIGRANLYGLGGRWGRAIDWLLARGI